MDTQNLDELIAEYTSPACLSLYYKGWINNGVGCLFYIGDMLCIMDTPWRKLDYNESPRLHGVEYKMAQTCGDVIADGLVAKIMAFYFNCDRFHKLYDKTILDKFWEFIKESPIYGGDVWSTWIAVLKIHALNPKVHELAVAYKNVIDYTAETLKKIYEYHLVRDLNRKEPAIKEYAFTFCIEDNLHNKKRVIEYFSPITEYNSIIPHIVSFEHWISECIPDFDHGETRLELMGLCALIFDCAINNRKLRGMTEEEYEYFYETYPDPQPWHNVNIDTNNDFKSIPFIKSLMNVRLTMVEDENSLAVLPTQYYSMKLDINWEDLFNYYITGIEKSLTELMRRKPNFPICFLQDSTLIYSLILYLEKIFYDCSMRSDLWTCIYEKERIVITQYLNQFFRYLSSKYGADDAKISPMSNEIIPIMPDLFPNLSSNICGIFKSNTSASTTAFHWPYYTANVEDSDKRAFENQIRVICASSKKNLTAELKTYLKVKEKQGMITRPLQTNAEYEIIKQFGYPHGEGAYYKG